jgi:putative ATP-binding cassette transporter
MSDKEPNLRSQTFRRLLGSVMIFLKSPEGVRARWMLVLLLLLMIGINSMNVANSYVGRYFMSSIETKDMNGFVYFAWLYVAVFAGSTLVGVLFRFTEERLGLAWRDWLTRRITGLYIDNRIYLSMTGEDAVSNPDQRMTDDVRQLTTTTLSFLLMVLNGSMAAISFSGVLWTISPKLFFVAVLYALSGSALTIWLGRPLVRLNYRQSDCEADYRAELIRTRENSDGIALAGRETDIRAKLMGRIDALVGNFRRITAVNRNLSFFTTGYNYMIQLIPPLLVAPLFIQGKVEFGVIGQATMAFATLLGALSLVITQFQAISSYASVVSRLGEFIAATEKLTARRASAKIEFSYQSDEIALTGLTLLSPADETNVLVGNLDLQLASGRRMMIGGPNRAGRIALFRALAGLHERGSGKILRPASGEVAFVPESPYLPPCSLRELFESGDPAKSVTDDQIHEVLEKLGLTSVIRHPAGFEHPRDWEESLSFQEMKLVATAQAVLAKPRYAFLMGLSALDETGRKRIIDLMAANSIACVTFGSQRPEPGYEGGCLELRDDGSWHLQNFPAAPSNS